MPERLDARRRRFRGTPSPPCSRRDAKRRTTSRRPSRRSSTTSGPRRRGGLRLHPALRRPGREPDSTADPAGRDRSARWPVCPRPTLEALHLAAARIRAFHERQRPADLDMTDADGIRLGWRWTPIDAVGLYVPGGTAAYPSSVLMNALPAKVAGLRAAGDDGAGAPGPPRAAGAGGRAHRRRRRGLPDRRCPGDRRAGLRHPDDRRRSTRSSGPGNAYVAAAKRRVFGQVGIDMIAGPSEVLVVADGGNDPAWIAADLLAQAEHDAAAQSILITDDADFADAVVDSAGTPAPGAAAARHRRGQLAAQRLHHPGRHASTMRRR